MKNDLLTTLQNNGVAIIATDTLYGIVGRALNKKVVERIYKLKKRTPTKPFIILISSIDDVKKFGVSVDATTQNALEKYWPGPISIILDYPYPEFEYLHRGTKSLAFRLPAKAKIVDLVRVTGPLVAPSANPEDLAPAQTINQARDYFGDEVDYYQEGDIIDKPSTIIRIHNGNEEVIRP